MHIFKKWLRMEVGIMDNRFGRDRLKPMMQALGLVYVLLLLAVCLPDASFHEKKAAIEREAGGKNVSVEAASAGEGMQPRIALTFDDGPNASSTPRLLEGLRERNVKATFFVIGANIEKEGNEEIIRQMYEDGHLIGNHTYHHVDLSKLSLEQALFELEETNHLIAEITGEEPEYVRPPFGAWKEELDTEITAIPVKWTVDPLDWTTENVQEIVEKVVTDTEENDMILLHDCYESSVEAALQIVDILKEEGYEFVTVDELLFD